MGMAIKIRTLLLERNMKIKDLAEKLGYSGNNLSNKLKNDNFSDKELRQIAEILNCDYEASFIMRDTGKII
ncbi:MAG: helix-turn-helix transcriptional regulator [Oscillospiraceae bacterium]|nr:helix-turn-helix transcriptional regulator [Oscillospiraceae bacterium]